MRNEVNFSKQNITRRNLIIYMMVYALISLIFKALSKIPINLETSTMEAYILILSFLLFTIQVGRLIGTPVKDENSVQERYMINKIGFHIILWGGILMHFVSNLIYNIWMETYSNTFISLTILLGFMVASLSAQFKGIYVNHKSIELDIKQYKKKIITNIGKLWLAAIGYATVIYSLSLTLQIPFATVNVVLSYILLSIILFSILYLLFSIYEKIDYEEKKLLKQKQQRSFLSKKVILLGLPIIGYSIIKSGVSFLYWQSRLSENFQLEQILNSVNELLLIWMIDFAVIALFLSYVIYRSIKSLPNDKPQLFKYFPILIWVNFIYTLAISGFKIYTSLYPGSTSQNIIQVFDNITSYFMFTIALFTLFIHIYIYPYLKGHHFPAAKIFLILPIFPILMRMSQILYENFSAYVSNVMYQINLAAFVLTIITSLLRYFVFCSMSNDLFELKLLEGVKEESKVVLNKKLIH